jgi:putrescine transport system ATP-binding protein
MGDMSIYMVRLESGRELRVTQTNVARKGADAFTWDEEVYLSWDPSSPVVGTG